MGDDTMGGRHGNQDRPFDCLDQIRRPRDAESMLAKLDAAEGKSARLRDRLKAILVKALAR